MDQKCAGCDSETASGKPLCQACWNELPAEYSAKWERARTQFETAAALRWIRHWAVARLVARGNMGRGGGAA